MKRTLIVTLLFTMFFPVYLWASADVVPLPHSVTPADGYFIFGDRTGITSSGTAAVKAAEAFRASMAQRYGRDIRSKGGSIRFEYDASMGQEEYTLKVDSDRIYVRGGDAGLFYAVKTLEQLVVHNDGRVLIPCMSIGDKPRFTHRGLSLDVARYFFPLDYIKRFLDVMSDYKLNRLHFHLTEDCGWRFEVKGHPELTRKGAWRSGTMQKWSVADIDRVPHGGFYTQDQLRDLVRYAEDRHITIMPEIDLPGHTTTILACYPELSCTGGPFMVPDSWGIREDILCAGNEDTYTLLEDILGQLMDVFPSEYIHIGGDEAPKTRWKQCPKCQAKIKEEGLADEHELQSYFIRRVEAMVNARGRKIVGWDEILEGGLAPNATVMSWRGEDGGLAAARMGHDVIMVPNHTLYIDYYQSDDHSIEPYNIGGFVPLDKVYNYEPYSSELTADQHRHIIGLQGNLWMEFIHSIDKLEYMAFPRAMAVAEVGWSDPAKDYPAFRKRLARTMRRLDDDGVLFRIPEPLGWDKAEVRGGKVYVTLENPVEGAEVYYTTDGSDPALNGKLYQGTIEVPLSFSGVDIKCRVILPSGRRSAIYTVREGKL